MMTNKIFAIPGAAWIALLVGLAAWLEQFFPNEVWLAATVGAIGLVIKAIETFWPKPPATTTERMMMAQPDTTERKIMRVFFGG